MYWRINPSLYYEIHKAIEDSISGLSRFEEPDYIAALVSNLPLKLKDVLNKAVPYINFKLGGCFIHQKPLAKFCDSTLFGTKSPEIGDLLIIYKEIGDRDTLYNALLLQAKKSTDIFSTPIPSNDAHQLLLYTKWPKFEYQRAGHLNGKVRSITPKTITTGAQYLLIDKSHCSTKSYMATTFCCAMPDNNLVASNSLACEIIRLIEFQTGKPFVCKYSHKDHWSQMIWDLLDISASSCFNRRRAGYYGADRYAGDPIRMFLDSSDDIFSDGQGVSVLCIEGDARTENHNQIKYE